jgi:hypothetical protein
LRRERDEPLDEPDRALALRRVRFVAKTSEDPRQLRVRRSERCIGSTGRDRAHVHFVRSVLFCCGFGRALKASSTFSFSSSFSFSVFLKRKVKTKKFFFAKVTTSRMRKCA